MKKVIFYFLVLFISFLSPSLVKAVEEVKTMNVASTAEQLFFVTVRLECSRVGKDGAIVGDVGTGFIVSYKWQNKEGLFLVTNKHVLKDVEKIKFFFIQSDGKKPILGKIQPVEMNNVRSLWYGHPNDKVDVGIIPISELLDQAQKKNLQLFIRSFNKDFLPTPQQAEDLDAVEEIMFVGYPSAIYDKVNYLPILRRGITATPLNVDYEGLPQFLIDATVFPGSSGSPVFLMNRGSYSTKEGGLVSGSRFFLLGLISEVYVFNQTNVGGFTDIPSTIKPVVGTSQMMGLGKVIKSSAIFETIETFLRLNGEIK